MRLGATDFVLKPCTPAALELVIQRVARTLRLQRENEYLRAEVTGAGATIVAESPGMLETLRSARKIARSKGTVLITGESGTGKERVAHLIHRESPRRDAPFIRVNCAALSETVLESELFGHERGAFTGAHKSREGRFELADGGTLLLDEIGDLPVPSQAAFLRVLQEHEVRPVGGTRPVRVDLRVVAATHRPLDQMAEAGDFRADLLARLAGHRIELPPLSLRREDMGLLLAALISRADPGLATRLRIQPAAVRAMLRYDWPANVRELEKCVATALLLARDAERIELEHLPERIRDAASALAASEPDDDDDDEARRNELVTLLRQHGGNVTAVARAMGKARMQIQRWMKRYDVDARSFRR
jgi:DNA-binding NtrC family response regulator